MEFKELLDIVRQGEGPHIEFKVDFTKQSHDIAKEMAAFANSGGGILLIGIDDSGNPKGIHDFQRGSERLAGIARSCSPPLQPEIDKFQITKDEAIIYAKVPSSPPCLYQGKFYVRVGSTSVEASGGAELEKLLINIGGFPRRIGSTPPNLFSPPPAKGFKGRANEIERLMAFLKSKTLSIAILEGISGIGKTALAIHFAEKVRQIQYIPFWMECYEDTSFDSIASALSTFAQNNRDDLLFNVLEDVTVNIEERISRIAAGVAESKYVLIFDNYHLVTDPIINRLFQKIAERAILIKLFLICRRRPKIASTIGSILIVEETLRVGLDSDTTTQLLTECGVNVSIKEAHQVWKLTGEGHPKALQIFIARSRNYPVEELLSSLPIFREELRNEWLTPLMNELTQEQKELAIDISIFDRPVSYQTFNLLYPGKEIYPLIISLVDQFILDSIGDNSLQMHLLIREYCYALISDKRSKHIWAAECYLDQSGRNSYVETLPDYQVDARIAAWSHLIKAGEHSRATEELDKLRIPLMNRGHYEQVMFLIDQTPLSPEGEHWYALDRARILSLWGDYNGAIAQILPLLEFLPERVYREAVLVLATIHNEHDKAILSKELLEKHHDRFLKDAPARTMRRFLYRLVESYSLIGELDQASKWATKVLELSEAEGDEISGARSLHQLARVLQAQKKYDTALSICQLSLNLFLKNNRLRDAAIIEMTIASIYKQLEDYESSHQSLQHSLQEFIRMGDRRNCTLAKKLINELKI